MERTNSATMTRHRWTILATTALAVTATMTGAFLLGKEPSTLTQRTPAPDVSMTVKPPLQLPPVKWKLSWQDGFEGRGKPSSLWVPLSGGGGWGHKALQYYTSEHARLNGSGALVITAAKQRNGEQCWYGSCQYISGRVQTDGTFSQRYGRFAARIKLPVGQGIWPAFWLKTPNAGTIHSDTYGEIDIAEIIGGKPRLLQAFEHAGNHRFAASMLLDHSLDSKYHTYGVDVTPSSITWWLDGKPYAQLEKYPGWPYDKPLFIILNVQVGGTWPGNPNASTRFPTRMSVDWVKVYRIADPA
ncbi:family 16 glycosylhydrolase [Planotetraspora sp. GP83]|uniref:glycoside hydrolase family 16 protein n=1 Tax=Planotetraspora sp. GP83 TaxID=3156264 RepID=UPI003512A5AC